MVIYFATDHAGYELKNELLAYVRDELGYLVEDCGALTYLNDDDFSDYIRIAAEKVSTGFDARAIILGGTGQGEAMCANRFPHVRATVYYHEDLDIIRLAREHNDSNVLSLGARFLPPESAKEAIKLWIETPFTHEKRHERRIEKLG